MPKPVDWASGPARPLAGRRRERAALLRNVVEPLAAPPAGILLVDDQPGNLVELEAILAPLGHELSTARSSEEALREILRRELALILLDTGMVGLRESGMVERIRQHPRSRSIPIVFLTAARRGRGSRRGSLDLGDTPGRSTSW